MDRARILEIERAAFLGWPAEEVRDRAGWRLRHCFGLTRRGNSVWPNELEPGPTLEERVREVEAYYAALGRPAIFQIGPASLPGTLDEFLARRDYERVTETEVRVGDMGTVVGRRAASSAFVGQVVVHEALTPGWFELNGERGRFRPRDLAVYRRLLGRVEGRAGFAVARLDGRLVASGLGVRCGAWLAVSAMRTLDEYRGRRAGEAVLRELARWGQRSGARDLVLQVEQDNTAAQRLYVRCGVERAFGYHYRRRR